MLMDEPFGAIDPINRERLQNEFLRLQQEIRKTIVFVTHDIDEAIKMGDRIAVLQKGGKLAQYAPPAELLMYPDGRFVEDFVGADRALKRLALQRVRDIDLWRAPLVRVGEPVAEARAKVARLRPPVPAAGGRRRQAARLAQRARPDRRAGRRPTCARAPSPWSSSTTCSATPSPTCSRTRPSTAPWSMPAGAVAGVLSVEMIGHALRGGPEQVRSGADSVVAED